MLLLGNSFIIGSWIWSQNLDEAVVPEKNLDRQLWDGTGGTIGRQQGFLTGKLPSVAQPMLWNYQWMGTNKSKVRQRRAFKLKVAQKSPNSPSIQCWCPIPRSSVLRGKPRLLLLVAPFPNLTPVWSASHFSESKGGMRENHFSDK